ncbi:MAG: hypothetical protein J0I20_14745 [Chloroflexi bacterium]|nr:hypothetical protein [Chloroflexota bacterium]OJW02758.1 MAG: hypothetical protein BGO39_05895 [Chloroflexi bacterium 54-19]
MPVKGNVRFSKGSTKQERPNTPALKNGQPTSHVEDHQSETTLAEETLPPFPVLMRWLEFYHTRTGQWPQPETLEETEPGSPAEKPLLTLLPTPAFFNASNTGLAGNRDQKEVNPRKPRLKTEKAVTSVKGSEKEEAPFSSLAAYNLKESVYYRTALDLIQKQAAFTASSLFSQNPQAGEETTLTLASFLAWCCLPLSGNLAKPKSEPVKMEMYLSLDRWSRLLKMRKATLGNCLKELAGLGLLDIADADGAVGKGNRVYRLAVALPQPLPLFDLLQDSTVNTSLNGQKPSEKIGELALSQFRVHETVGERELQPEPFAMNHASNLESKKIKSKKHEHENQVEVGTGDFNDEKLLFLLETASFPGYASPEGLITLAEKEAQKFAADPRLDLASLKRIYSQVLATWSAGKCTKNPLGLFHYSLTRHLKQPATGAPSRPGNLLPLSATPDQAGTVPFKKNSNSSRHQPTLHKYTRGKSYASFENETTLVSTSVVEDAPFEEPLEPVVQGGKTEAIAELNLEEIRAGLQKHAIEALNNRFRQPGLAGTLDQLAWVFSITDNKVRLELQKTGSHFLAVSRLGQAELSLIKIALSQGLRTITGKSLEIEVFLAS